MNSVNRIKVMVFSVCSIIVVLVLWLFFHSSSNEIISPAIQVIDDSIDSRAMTPTLVQPDLPATPEKNIQASEDEKYQTLSRDEKLTDSGQFLSNIDILKEIAARISEGQLEESENELTALVQKMDSMTDSEKVAFVEYFIDYSNNNAFNPEVVTAFDALWPKLTLDLQTKLDAAKLLASHYSNSYELTLALAQFNLLTELGASLDAKLYRELAFAQFGLGQYPESVPSLLAHIDLQTSQGETVNRREYSMLFESYYRSGDFGNAEWVGNLILDYYNDIQDWKDMQTFYEATGNETGLETLRSQASEAGLLNPSGEWAN